MGRVQDQVAVVTGAANGLWRAIALRLAGEGARMALGDIEGAALERTVSDITKQGGHASAPSVTSPRRRPRRSSSRRGGALRPSHILVNVGGSWSAKIWEMAAEQWAFHRPILRSVFLCTGAAVRHMMKQRSGRIVCLSSGAREARRGRRTIRAARSTRRRKRVSTASSATWPWNWPSRTSWSMPSPRGPSTPSARPRPSSAERNGRVQPEPHDAPASPGAAATRYAAPFLASEEASYITGVTLQATGGRSRSARETIRGDR